MMKEELNIADVLDYMADVWGKKLDADKRKDYNKSEKLFDDFFAMEDLVVYCMGQDDDETREQIARRVQSRISDKVFREQMKLDK